MQDWFDNRSSPAERAMRSLLEQYFALPFGPERQDFADLHPEISVYFERRRVERDAERAALEAFDDADPRLAPYFREAQDMIAAADRMRARLRHAREVEQGIAVRRERSPVS